MLNDYDSNIVEYNLDYWAELSTSIWIYCTW